MRYKFKYWHIAVLAVVLFLLYQGGYIKGFMGAAVPVQVCMPDTEVNAGCTGGCGQYTSRDGNGCLHKWSVNAIEVCAQRCGCVAHTCESAGGCCNGCYGFMCGLCDAGLAHTCDIGGMITVTKYEDGDPCSSASDCVGGFCNNNKCSSVAPKADGTLCAGIWECLTGHFCVSSELSCSQHICWSTQFKINDGCCDSAAGETQANSPIDCAPLTLPDGDSCTSASECTGGYCVGIAPNKKCASTSCPVVFRTNTINYPYNPSGAWIAIDKNSDNILESYTISGIESFTAAEITQLHLFPFKTQEGFDIFDSPTHHPTAVYVDSSYTDGIPNNKIFSVEYSPGGSAVLSTSPVPGYEGKEVYASGATGCPAPPVTCDNDNICDAGETNANCPNDCKNNGDTCTVATQCNSGTGWCVGGKCASNGNFHFDIKVTNSEATKTIDSWIQSMGSTPTQSNINSAFASIVGTGYTKTLTPTAIGTWSSGIIDGSLLTDGMTYALNGAVCAKWQGTAIQTCQSGSGTVKRTGQVISS